MKSKAPAKTAKKAPAKGKGKKSDGILSPADEKALDRAWESVVGGKKSSGSKIAGKKKK